MDLLLNYKTLKIYIMELKQLALKVKELREAQKNFFRIARKGSTTHERDLALDRAKQLEKEVDDYVQNILEPVNTQKNLF